MKMTQPSTSIIYRSVAPRENSYNRDNQTFEGVIATDTANVQDNIRLDIEAQAKIGFPKVIPLMKDHSRAAHDQMGDIRDLRAEKGTDGVTRLIGTVKVSSGSHTEFLRSNLESGVHTALSIGFRVKKWSA